MKETDKHKAAFEYYLSLQGKDRSITAVAREYKMSRAAVAKWSKGFKWQKRLQERADKNGEAIAKANDKIIVKDGITHAKKVNDALRLIQAALATAIPSLQNGTFKVDRATDLAAMCRALSDLIRLDQLLSGEADSRTAHVLTVTHVYKTAAECPHEIIEGEVVE